MAPKAQNFLIWAVLCRKGRRPRIHLGDPQHISIYEGHPDWDLYYLSGFEPEKWDYMPGGNGEIWLVSHKPRVFSDRGRRDERRPSGRRNLHSVKKNPEEDLIQKILSLLPADMETILEETGEDPSRVLSTLTMMELEGKVVKDGGMWYPGDHPKPERVSPHAQQARRELEKLLKHLIDARAAMERARGKGEEEIKDVIKRYVRELSERATLLLNPALENQGERPYNGDMSRMENLLERMLRTMEEGFSSMEKSMEKGFSSLQETMERGFSRVEKRLEKIDHRLGSIENALGIPAEGRGREVLLEWLRKKGEKVEKVQVSVKRKPEDVVVYTDRAVYVMEAKNQITGDRVGQVLKQIKKHVRRIKEGLEKEGKEKDVVPVVYAWKMSKKAIRELEKHGVMVLYEGKDTLAA